MNRPPKPALVMLLWQVVSFTMAYVPQLLLLRWLNSEAFSPLLGLGVVIASEVGVVYLLLLVFDHGFRTDDDSGIPSARVASLRAFLNLLKLPLEFKNFAALSLVGGMFIFAIAWGYMGDFTAIGALSSMTALWLSLIGYGWVRWRFGGLRYRPEPEVDHRPEGTRRIVLVRDSGDDGESVWMRWRAVEGCTLAQIIRDIPGTGFLPSIPGGERRWEITADGEPVAVITQSWTGTRWWPEPEWLVDPETPFTGERVTLTLRESQTQ